MCDRQQHKRQRVSERGRGRERERVSEFESEREIYIYIYTRVIRKSIENAADRRYNNQSDLRSRRKKKLCLKIEQRN